MRTHPLVLAAFGLAFPVFAAAPLNLHRGSTREWVKYTGSRPDSVRVRLEFLDSTYKDSSTPFTANVLPPGSTVYESKTATRKEVITEWKVRITIPDSASIKDSAVLRVSSVYIGLDVFGTGSDVRLLNLAYWKTPSKHFPIDVQLNPAIEVNQYLRLNALNYPPTLPTGAWELGLLNNDPMRRDLRLDDDGSLSTTSLGSGFSGSPPIVSRKDSIGITGWLRKGSYWKLSAADGKTFSRAPGGLVHRLKKGESWVYRDSSKEVGTFPPRSMVFLELLETPSDSVGWTRLTLRKTVHPDLGSPKDTTITIFLDTLHHLVRTGTESGTPWSLPKSLEGRWGIGLMKHLLAPDSAVSLYKESFGSSQGEANRTASWNQYVLKIDKDIGATSIRTDDWYSIAAGGSPTFMYSWTLVGHSLDNIILPSSTRSPARIRDLAWLKERIDRDATLEVARFGLDGSCLRGSGTEALRLLELRGVGVVRLRDGQEMVDLRVIHP